MRLISAEEVRRALDIPSTAAAIRDALLGEATAPDRHHHAVPDGAGRDTVLLLMPAWTPGGYLGVKLATVAPGNAAKGLPTVIASYLLHEAATGRPLALMDGTMLTLRRTAAASALAADALARKDASRLVVVGTGALAPHLAEAHAAMRPITRIDVWGRDPAKARATGGRPGGAGPAGATRTRSGSGGARGGHRHLRDDLARAARARRLAAPRHASRSRRRLHARRCARPMTTRCAAPASSWTATTPATRPAISRRPGASPSPICARLRRGEAGRESEDEITLFKSVGMAVEDLAAAILVTTPARGT